MHYYLDGYNLMFRLLRAGGDLKAKRSQIIKDIYQKSTLLDLKVTLVFDAQYQPEEFSKGNFHQLEILYSNYGQTADECILSELKHVKTPHLYTVVTSDKKLAWLARLRHLKTETVEEFVCWLNQRVKNKLREIKKGPQPVIVPKAVVPKESPKPPQEGSNPEDCFKYYLESFQQAYLLIREQDAQKKEQRLAKKSQKSGKPRKKGPPPQDLSEPFLWDYWLNAFEKGEEETP